MADSTSADRSRRRSPAPTSSAPRNSRASPSCLEGEDPATALAAGTARRRALDAALAEIERGPRRALGRVAPRVLADARPRAPARRGRAAPGRRHHALRPPGRRALGHADRAPAEVQESARTAAATRQRQWRSCRRRARARAEDEPRTTSRLRDEDEDEDDEARRGRASRRGRGAARLGRGRGGRGARSRRRRRGRRGPQRRPPLLVRARHRRRQDRGRARLRRGLAHRRRPDPHPPPQPRRPVQRRAAPTAATRSASAPPLLGRDKEPDADGPVTVETYQWFVRNAGKVSDAYTIVICDEAHTALGEKTSAAIRQWKGPVFVGMTATGALIARHVTDLFPTQTSRFDLAQAARRGVIAPLRCVRIPPGRRRAHDRQGAAAQGRGRPGLRPGGAGRAARPGAVQHGGRRPLQRRASRTCRASSTPPA